MSNENYDYEKQMQKHQRSQELRKARKKSGRRNTSRKPRRNDWSQYSEDYWEDADYESFERIMPLDENDRRRSVEQMAFKKQVTDNGTDEANQTPGGQTGVVSEVSSGLCRVQVNDRELLCTLRGALKAEETGFTNVVAVGDQVIVTPDGDERGVVEAVLPRRSMLVRPDVFASHLRQVVVANVDQLLIVAAWRDPHIWLELIDRYLVTAEHNNLEAVICVNKLDLVEDQAEFQVTLQPYRELGFRVIATSAVTGAGIDELRELLRDKTTVLAGMSGVGKSSLLSAVDPDLDLRTKTVSESSGEGRHTTTQVNRLPLVIGGTVIDTPGMREFGVAGIMRSELEGYFQEIVAVSYKCRFSDCAHLNEPGCAVQDAVSAGQIAESRYYSYTKIYANLPE